MDEIINRLQKLEDVLKDIAENAGREYQDTVTGEKVCLDIEWVRQTAASAL